MRIAAWVDRAANLPTQDQASDATRAVQPDWGPAASSAPEPLLVPGLRLSAPVLFRYRPTRRAHCALARSWPPAHAPRPVRALLPRSGRRVAMLGPFPAPWFCGFSPRVGGRRGG